MQLDLIELLFHDFWNNLGFMWFDNIDATLMQCYIVIIF